jgi:hypothetical protein
MAKQLNLSDQFHRDGHIVLDDFGTWQPDLLALLTDEQSVLDDFNRKQQHMIMKQCMMFREG